MKNRQDKYLPATSGKPIAIHLFYCLHVKLFEETKLCSRL